MTQSEDVLAFWFEGVPPEGPVPAERLRFWFNGGEEADRRIRERFGELVARGGRGELDGWEETPRGSLALVVVLDQFPRNIFRNAPEAYAFDSRALAAALAGMGAGRDRALTVMERAFYYLPLEHAEDLAIQERSVEVFARLSDEAPAALRETCRGFLDYAVRHRDIVARFGRFPHRNWVLGRKSSPEEEEFLKQPGSSF